MIERKNEFRVRLSQEERIMLEQIATAEGGTGATAIRKLIRDRWKTLDPRDQNETNEQGLSMRKVTRVREWHDDVQDLANDYLKYSQQARAAHEQIIELLRPVGRATSRNKVEKTSSRSPNPEPVVPGMFLEITFTGIVPNYSEHRIEFSFCEGRDDHPDSWSLSTSNDIANEEVGDQCLRLKFDHETAAHKANEARQRAEAIFNSLFQEKKS